MSYNRFSDSDDDEDEVGEETRSSTGYNSEKEFYNNNDDDEETGGGGIGLRERDNNRLGKDAPQPKVRPSNSNKPPTTTAQRQEGTTSQGITSKLTSPAFLKSLFTSSNSKSKSSVKEEDEEEEKDEKKKKQTTSAPNGKPNRNTHNPVSLEFLLITVFVLESRGRRWR